MGRRSSRRFHIIQKSLGARRHATPPLGSFTLPSGNRASTDPAPICLKGSSAESCPRRSGPLSDRWATAGRAFGLLARRS
eukprot:7386438-Pyramimonas_sp.AAC.1